MLIPLDVALQYGPEPQTVSTIYRRLKANSRAYLVSTADDNLFYMKAPPRDLDAWYGRRELFAHAIGTRLGFSMAPRTILQVEQAALAEYRVCNAGEDTDDLFAGAYFGSKLPHPSRIYEYLPMKWARKEPEIARQLGCIRILNLWTANTVSHRYACTSKDGIPKRLVFSSHAHPPDQEIPERSLLLASETYRFACLTAGSATPIDCFIADLGTLARADLEAAFIDVPLAWRDPDDEADDIALLESRRDWICELARSGSFAAN